jgi:hypothetical protein
MQAGVWTYYACIARSDARIEDILSMRGIEPPGRGGQAAIPAGGWR